MENMIAVDDSSVKLNMATMIHEPLEAHGFFTAQCFDKDGNEKWKEDFPNVVTTVGKTDQQDKYFAGAAYTATWYMGLISLTGYTTGPSVNDTMASHSGWQEDIQYVNATRPAPTWLPASGGSKATNALAFVMNAGTTIKGVFLNTVNTKNGTTGTLYSAGLFSGGDNSVSDTDTISVTWTGTMS